MSKLQTIRDSHSNPGPTSDMSSRIARMRKVQLKYMEIVLENPHNFMDTKWLMIRLKDFGRFKPTSLF